MAVIDPAEEINELGGTLRGIQDVLDLDALRKQIAELEEQAAAPDLWNDPDQAQRVTSRLSHIQAEVNRVDGLSRRLEDLPVLFELAAEEGDEDALAEADRELAALRAEVGALEVRTLLAGEYDAREALVTINSQAGGVDAADWAQMLLRMYLRWSERKGYPAEVYETSYAEEAGIKSATFAVKAPYAYGTLRASTAPTGWSGSARSTTRAVGRPPSRAWTSSRWSSRPTTSTSTRTTCASTSTGRPGRAARA